ncbi:MAG TPA: hypothetical protein VJU77_17855 [Chthoniobacterales bacterium]|nr:hypothetical protein [Chthoniobacterales bacterium]
MKNSILIALLAVSAFGTFNSAQAYERRNEPIVRDQRRENRESDFRQLRAELYQLNIMFSRVDAHLSYGSYRGGNQLRWKYSRLLRERDRLNYELGRRPLDRLRLHAQIDRLREDLRELEVRLRFHPRHYYR